ncbi:M18 family aminopeptidase [Streptobacillus moniliformis]|uniref:M18 family aminopeptidase n=1 Tax=Streptobacillus moniliformis (strain ATCC 14647 / DSM 12112 / NCTC 10651 / 9901) TaxID=519441 RepID=D1AX41_STRM9|nr:M18 family aminopeptidase [Streptobacillus moniliformis]ACZ00867.1 Aspartyl aminopeptidase [Streptobacillus moniliformis DSM 12112]AVL42744.1 M18 family aminopeptidase [Streptobacillus moniliformis]QXW65615.1 M18 family aminopeptidase [Streptobacillus moniliformis]SQA13996.1 Probable M18 family aminopeptidase 2 [Streptobacillus moniliformis]
MNNKKLKAEFLDLEIKSFAREMIEFIDDSPSTYHVVGNCSTILLENNFERLEPTSKWELKKGGKYFIKRSNSSIVAFTIGEKLDVNKGFKIFGSHTDSPGFRIKPNPEMTVNGLIRLNTEVYGGPILSTWFDRPLSVAGRVIIKTDDIFRPKTIKVKIDEPVLIIPNLAIHQNREVNNGIKIDKQNDILPIIGLVNENFEKDGYLIDLISKKCNIKKEDILDFDLYVYATEKGSLVGVNQEFVSAPKLDNLVSVYSGLLGLVEAENANNQINVFVGFDNEEIGSATKQGADSNYLSNILERIIYSLGMDRNTFLTMLSSSFILSADGAHAAHPAYLGKSDPTNLGKINNGVQLKISANQRYTSDGFSIAVVKQIIEGTDIKIQFFVNQSNEIGGSTIGPISSTHLDIDSIDLGVPMLAMHSVRELCGVRDLFYLKELAKEFFSKN